MKIVWKKAVRVVERVSLGGALAMPMLAIAQTSQFQQLNDTLNNVVSVLQGAGVATVTIAIVWAGYKMVFQHARWADISTVVLGAMFIGASATIAKWLVGS